MDTDSPYTFSLNEESYEDEEEPVKEVKFKQTPSLIESPVPPDSHDDTTAPPLRRSVRKAPCLARFGSIRI